MTPQQRIGASVRHPSGDTPPSDPAVSARPRIRIGTAGWSIPRASAFRFDLAGTHLQRYANHFTCAEINSSFHRPHAVTTYAKWRDSTPPEFKFAVKMPRAITHELKLARSREPLMAFLAQTDGLSTKRGPILMQLPPSFAFDAVILTTFLDQLRATFDGPVVCEPRHVTWFGPEAVELLRRYRIGLVIADPPTIPAAEIPDTGQAITYYRLHGQPRMYWSKYDESYLASLDTAMSNASHATEVWCIFDNTASGAAIENAWELCARLAPGT